MTTSHLDIIDLLNASLVGRVLADAGFSPR